MVCQETFSKGYKHDQCQNEICKPCYTNWRRVKGHDDVNCPLCRGSMDEIIDCTPVNYKKRRTCKCGSTTHSNISHHACPLKEKKRPAIVCTGTDEHGINCEFSHTLNRLKMKFTDQEWVDYRRQHNVITTSTGEYKWVCPTHRRLHISDSDDDSELLSGDESELVSENNNIIMRTFDISDSDEEEEGHSASAPINTSDPSVVDMKWSDIMTCHRLLQTYSIDVIRRNLHTINMQIQMDNE